MQSLFCDRIPRFFLALTIANLPYLRQMHHLARLFLLLLTVGLLSESAVARGQLRLSYLGTAGWEMTDGKTFIHLDPPKDADPALFLATL